MAWNEAYHVSQEVQKIHQKPCYRSDQKGEKWINKMCNVIKSILCTLNNRFTGHSIRGIIHNTRYGWVKVSMLGPWCYRWTALWLIQITHMQKVTSLLWVWRSRIQLTQNLMAALLYCITIIWQLEQVFQSSVATPRPNGQSQRTNTVQWPNQNPAL